MAIGYQHEPSRLAVCFWLEKGEVNIVTRFATNECSGLAMPEGPSLTVLFTSGTAGLAKHVPQYKGPQKKVVPALDIEIEESETRRISTLGAKKIDHPSDWFKGKAQEHQAT